MLVATSLSFLHVAGCTSQTGDDLDPGEVEDQATPDDGKADAASASTMKDGTYGIAPDYAAYWQLTVSSDYTFGLRGGCKPNPTGPSCFAITIKDGTYKFTHSGSDRYIRLYDDNDDLIVRFEYAKESSGSYKLTDTSTHKNYTAKPSN
jgi:hypothetical protein